MQQKTIVWLQMFPQHWKETCLLAQKLLRQTIHTTINSSATPGVDTVICGTFRLFRNTKSLGVQIGVWKLRSERLFKPFKET